MYMANMGAGENSAKMRVQLYEILLVEKSYELVNEVLNGNSLSNVMIKLEKALPCLLHLENRSSEAIISNLLLHGLLFVKGNKAAT